MKSPSLKSLKQNARHGRTARSSIGLVVRAALGDDVLRLLSHEPGARQFRPEDIHQMRTSVRRLRSDLRFFRPMLDDPALRPIRDELRWLAGVLGVVRDLDVLEDRLRAAVVALDCVGPSDPLFEEIDRRRQLHRSTLGAALDGDRYASLRAAIIAEARTPTLADGHDRPAGAVLADRLGRDWRRFLDALEASSPDAPIATLHEFRKQAKRTRYAAESVADWLGRPAGTGAKRIGRRAKQVQEILGLSQDAHVAIAFIEDLMQGLPADGPSRDAAIALLDRQAVEAEEALSQYRSLRDRMLHD
ncbi:CHAD domain-containing protein [Tautonia rosea]|uniref:CHAD domain-containing protein n=1 Tax=Tautonia rosea TaxID=2728037 RepID=UPI0014744BC0|nr:CHAD domain-containing protein [Tautonia rosea]